jgi:transglutaminase-like putative cysteine protease
MVKIEEGWATVLLLTALVVVAAWGVEAPGNAPGLWAASVCGILGVLAGLALSKSRFNGLVATLFAVCYGLFATGFLITLVLRGSWYNRTWELLIRVNNFLYYALHGGTSRDILPFSVMVALIFWAIGVTAAWAIFRRGSIWPAILPAGIILLINAYYYPGERLELYLAAYLVLALLLLTRISLLSRERQWRATQVAFSSDTRFEFLRAGLVAALVVVALAWMGQQVTQASASPTAAAAWEQVNGSWATVRENFERLFNAVRNPNLAANDFYGDSLVLTNATSLSERHIMDVTVAAVKDPRVPTSEEEPLPPIARLYWRGKAYQEYSSEGGWSTGDAVEFREFTPNATSPIRLPAFRLRRDVNATFTMQLEAVSTLYVLPQPRALDRAATFSTFLGPGNITDPVAVRAQSILTGDDRTYQVIASVSVADVESLRNAGVKYPEWVTSYFLQVPESVTERTRALAKQIVTEAGARNPFDQAQAITSWLRQEENIQYATDVGQIPVGAEPIDWFLFESRRGFCNYYASAMVLMLRSLGVPARMAAGFAQGELDRSTGQYVVRERNAHAWPEVYFPDYGWIEFEPTASETPLVRPERSASENSNDDVPALPTQTRDEDILPDDATPPEASANRPLFDWALIVRWGTNLGVVLGVLAVLMLAAIVVLLRFNLIGLESLGQPGRRLLQWMGRAVPSAVTRAYLELERAARWLGLKLPDHLTPHERAAALNDALPHTQAAVDTITSQYVAEQYSPYPEYANGQKALDAWRGMRRSVWREGIGRFFRRWTEDDWTRAMRATRQNGQTAASLGDEQTEPLHPHSPNGHTHGRGH